MHLIEHKWSVLSIVILLCSGCAVGPDYQRPSAPVPQTYKEQKTPQVSTWVPAEPKDTIDRGTWWTIYKDPILNDLEQQVEISNQNIKVAEANYRQAHAVVSEARASLFPTLSLTASERTASERSGSSTSNPGRNVYNLSLEGSWEPDIWGRIRRTIESDKARSQASAADLAAARLSAQTDLAIAYFQLRSQDELKVLLERAVSAYTQALKITQNRYSAGVASKADVLSAETQLKSAQVQAINTGIQRSNLEHAIAILIGKAPADFSLPPGSLTRAIPEIPVGLPSTLLERRPDIASAERLVAAQNAQIGVAISAYFPSLTLTGSYGFASAAIGTLLHASNNIWSLGPSLAETIFNGGANIAREEEARAAYEQSVANYRQKVLTSFQEVEDYLGALRILKDETSLQKELVKSAHEAEQITLNQYKAGTVSYSSVILAQTSTLSSEQNALATHQNLLVNSVSLIKALGGGWNITQLPNS